MCVLVPLSTSLRGRGRCGYSTEQQNSKILLLPIRTSDQLAEVPPATSGAESNLAVQLVLLFIAYDSGPTAESIILRAFFSVLARSYVSS